MISHRVTSFALLLLTLAVDAERGYRTKFETLEADVAATVLADTVLVVVNLLQCLVDLVDKLAISVAEAELTVALLKKDRQRE